MGIDSSSAAGDSLSLVQPYYAAFNGGDWERMRALLTGDAAHDINAHDIHRGGPETERKTCRDWIRQAGG